MENLCASLAKMNFLFSSRYSNKMLAATAIRVAVLTDSTERIIQYKTYCPAPRRGSRFASRMRMAGTEFTFACSVKKWDAGVHNQDI